jgi:hypothetical protein
MRCRLHIFQQRCCYRITWQRSWELISPGVSISAVKWKTLAQDFALVPRSNTTWTRGIDLDREICIGYHSKANLSPSNQMQVTLKKGAGFSLNGDGFRSIPLKWCYAEVRRACKGTERPFQFWDRALFDWFGTNQTLVSQLPYPLKTIHFRPTSSRNLFQLVALSVQYISADFVCKTCIPEYCEYSCHVRQDFQQELTIPSITIALKIEVTKAKERRETHCVAVASFRTSHMPDVLRSDHKLVFGGPFWHEVLFGTLFWVWLQDNPLWRPCTLAGPWSQSAWSMCWPSSMLPVVDCKSTRI